MAGVRFSKRDKAREAKRKQLGLFEDNPPGVDPTWHYWAFFRLLQLSESYWIAHKAHIAGASPQTEWPSDFEKVQRTYGLFGPVWDIPFWEWWRFRARARFGTVERVHVVTDQGTRDAPPLPDILADGETEIVRLVLSVPLVGTRTSVLKQVENILRQHQESWLETPPSAAYNVVKDRTRGPTMNAAIRAVQARAHFTEEQPLHFVGQRSKFVPKTWGPDYIDQISLSEVTSRHIRRAFLWSENAVRGRFPSQNEPEADAYWPKFDFVGLKDRLATYVRVSQEALEAIPESERTSEHRYAGRNRTIDW